MYVYIHIYICVYIYIWDYTHEDVGELDHLLLKHKVKI